jgi:murein L,D-transpeptidase YcbB/YkuD
MVIGEQTLLQDYNNIFNTPQDGVISKPSMLIKAIQQKVGAKQDGYLGQDTIRKMQAHFGTIQDGVISKPSSMVKAMQTALNKNTF